jgi:putative transposase
MYQAYKFRLYPTAEQQQYFAGAFGCSRWFWNYSLNMSQETYKASGKGLSRGAIQGLLPQLKIEYPWLKKGAYSQSLQVVALNLSVAYQNFFEKKAGFPSFKSKHGRQSVSYPQNVKVGEKFIKLPIIGEVNCKVHRTFEGTVKTVTVSKNPDGKYFASILVDDGIPSVETTTEGKAIGLDVGLIDFCVTSDGSKYKNPRHLQKHSKNLKRKQQKLSRKQRCASPKGEALPTVGFPTGRVTRPVDHEGATRQKGSSTRNKARRLVAKVHSKIKRVREDFLHKLSRKIVNENQVIAVEDLNVKGMVRNHCLAKSISDAGWGMFGTMLKYKTEKDGKTYIEVDRFFPSSKTCNSCLHKVSEMPLDVRHWDCPKCKSRNERDVNAAKNIRDEALRIIALGTSASANGRSVSRGGKISVLSDAVPVEVGSYPLSVSGG